MIYGAEQSVRADAVLYTAPPAQIIRFPGGELTGKGLLEEIARSITPLDAPEFNSLRPLPQRLSELVMLQLAAAQNGISVSDNELSAAIHEYARGHGGVAMLEASISPVRGLADIARQMRLQMIRGKLAKRWGLADTDGQGVAKKLQQLYKPRWFTSAQGQVLANIAGRDYTRTDLAAYVFAYADDAELKRFIEQILCRQIVFAEARNMQVYKTGMDMPAAMEAVAQILLTPEALMQWLQAKEKDFYVYELRFPRAQEFAGGTVSEAKAYARSVRSGEKSLTGKTMYFGATPGVMGAPPEAYGLDYIYTPQKISPLLAVGPEWTEWVGMVSKAKPLDVLAPLLINKRKALYSAGKFLRRRPPQNPRQLLPLLKVLRSEEELRRLYQGTMRSDKTTVYWTCGERRALPAGFSSTGDVGDIEADQLPQIEE